MTSLRIISLTLFAAFSGLFFVGIIRFQSLALLFFGATSLHFALDYRKLKGSDEKSTAFQNEIATRTKDIPLCSAKDDYAKILAMGMIASLLMIVVTALNSR